MKITACNSVNTNNVKQYPSLNTSISVPVCVAKCSEPHLPAVRSNQLASRGIIFSGRNINQLYEEYNWFINHDHEKPIKAFLKMKDSPETMDNFLTAILSTEDRSYQFIDSIVRSGKELLNITTNLRENLPSSSKNLMTFMPDNPYRMAYEKYITRRFDNANTMSEILRIRPDWDEAALIGKYEHLKPGGGFKIGKIPNEFPLSESTYDRVIEHLRPNMQNGFKQEQKIPDLQIGHRIYQFSSFTNGKSDKNVFCVTVPEGKKFVIKMCNENDRTLNNPFGLGTLAKIDTYLTTNRSKNSAPLRFYDHKRNVSIYEYIEHCPIAEGNTAHLDEVNRKLSDFNKLGLYYNDTVGTNNYFRLEDVHRDLMDEEEIKQGIRNNEWISVDNDHVTFSSILHPVIEGLHKPLPNLMGLCC
ncbi:MAG: hypothetical protein LUB59_03340 [Candidatus Gastranaerophilales bacterium]|nr:hypothetical protein [Candidatus Gastranaerophilales bacterium]